MIPLQLSKNKIWLGGEGGSRSSLALAQVAVKARGKKQVFLALEGSAHRLPLNWLGIKQLPYRRTTTLGVLSRTKTGAINRVQIKLGSFQITWGGRV